MSYRASTNNQKHGIKGMLTTKFSAIAVILLLLMGCESRLDRHAMICARLHSIGFTEDEVKKLSVELHLDGDFNSQAEIINSYCYHLTGR